ncbi:transferase [Myroides marinus]|uniref:transferase n=1 Tax=Myroides marinus TaxID=703342 RepID=UPI002578361B|nr:transferase [Myroides marinus]MDM1352179.1 transferase [Myroides marinus]MDM1359382.1 transferase [Myroides marinus]MDM1366509.1 transferase [Myroides marinus]
MIQLTDKLYSDVSKEELLVNLIKRLSNFFDISSEENQLLKDKLDSVLFRLEKCIDGVDNKYFRREGKAFFSHVHSGQYLIFLYYYSNEINQIDSNLMDKIYYLNKILHSVDIYGAIGLPEIFFFEHPLGLVLGRAVYGNNFFAMQGCTVGGNKGCYPSLGNNLKMYSNSKILGNCIIGNNVIVAANTYIKDQNIPANSMVFGSSPNLIIKEIK